MEIRKMMSAAAAVMVGSVLLGMPFPAHAAEGFETTENADGTLSINWTDTSAVTAEIPEEIGGKTVTALSEGCFDGCSALEQVMIPETVTDIGSYAFEGCVLLDTVTIPASVTKIGDFAFEGCYSLTGIEVEDGSTSYTSRDGVLYSAGETTLLRYPAAKEDSSYRVSGNCTSISPWGFTDCRYLQTIDTAEVQVMGADCFMGCAALREITLSDQLTELVGAAFAHCENLRSVTLPKGLRSIGDRCFFGCAAIEKLTIPDRVTSIGEQAFFGCANLKFLRVPRSVRSIGREGIGYSVNSSGESVLIPDFKMEALVGSYAVTYAKENGIPCAKKITGTMAAFAGIGAVLVILLVIGITVSIRQSKARKREEEERIAQEQKEKMLAERRAARKKEKEKKE